MRDLNLPPEIEVFEVGSRRLYVKLTQGAFAIFEDELSPEELMGIAHDILARRTGEREPVLAAATDGELAVNSGE